MLSSRPVTLANGTRLGPYEILGPLGAGGMGEVYRARDPRLGREVAVKVLPHAVAGDPERQQRFETEARAAGSLNHPNIVTLHDVGLSNGVPYLVTEILEGESLRDLIERGPVSTERATALVVEIAQGLAAAHAKGIIHRDLKPENLFVLPDGRVKILDFGIAKLTRTESTAQAETTPVFASLTVAGTIMGTVSYMAPEQLRDRPVDQRADLFALGAIFHELLTGKQPFEGETAADRVTAILSHDPPPVPAEAEREVPGIGAVIQRLLAKRPEGRFDTANDLAFTLDLLSRRVATPSKAAGSLESPALTPRVSFRPLTFRDGEIFASRFAPDGQTVVYQAAFGGEPSEIYLTRVETPDARPLGLPKADLQSVSGTAEIAVTLRPRDVGGFVRLGTLARVPMIGGRPRELAEDVFQAAWSPDGKSLAAVRMVGGSFQLEAPLGTVIYKPSAWISDLCYSQDGKQIAFLDHPYSGSNGGMVRVIRPGEEPRTLTSELGTVMRVVWSPDGREIWFTGYGEGIGGITAVTLDGRIRHLYSASGLPLIDDVAQNGDALITTAQPRMRMETSTRSEGEAGAIDLSCLDWTLLRDITPDGSMALFDETGAGAGEAPVIFVRSTDGSPPIRLAEGVCATISPDGRSVLAAELKSDGRPSIIPIGAGQTRYVSTGDMTVNFGDWMPNGRELVLNGAVPGEGRHIYLLDIETGAKRRIHDMRILGQNLRVSPDGTRVLARTEAIKTAIFFLDGSEPLVFEDLDQGWRTAGWAADSASFFAYKTGSIPTPVVRVHAETGAREPWMEIVPRVRSGVHGVNSVRLS
ncbi:MAG TPA: WD40 repeat domain-containing serine/threonine protein kinase, partial [Candidatus Eisenbacteria bacterium]|nr:WD40 repeat domain-containing serine/threonine protein kinase [Candidatus Eisenbacteria bacterium]